MKDIAALEKMLTKFGGNSSAVKMKKVALERKIAKLEKELEGMDRGRYSAPVGWIAANGDGEFGIALRCALIETEDRKTLRLFAGCGIVAGSNPEKELEESNAKMIAMRSALH